jgi:hypothetical protein
MTLKEFTLLKKFLMLAANNKNDAEAIASFKQATAVLHRNGFTWEMAMNRVVTVVAEVQSAVSDDDAVTEALFDQAIRRSSGSFRDTIENVYAQWQEKSWLSPRQWAMVRKAAGEE